MENHAPHYYDMVIIAHFTIKNNPFSGQYSQTDLEMVHMEQNNSESGQRVRFGVVCMGLNDLPLRGPENGSDQSPSPD